MPGPGGGESPQPTVTVPGSMIFRLVMYLCKKAETTIATRICTTTAAAKIVGWGRLPVELLNEVRKELYVCAGVPLERSQLKKKSFQENKKAMTALAAMPGAASGRRAFLNAWNFVQPSTRAASSRSRGRAAKNPIKIQATMGIVMARWTITIPGMVPLSPMAEKRK